MHARALSGGQNHSTTPPGFLKSKHQKKHLWENFKENIFFIEKFHESISKVFGLMECFCQWNIQKLHFIRFNSNLFVSLRFRLMVIIAISIKQFITLYLRYGCNIWQEWTSELYTVLRSEWKKRSIGHPLRQISKEVTVINVTRIFQSQGYVASTKVQNKF